MPGGFFRKKLRGLVKLTLSEIIGSCDCFVIINFNKHGEVSMSVVEVTCEWTTNR